MFASLVSCVGANSNNSLNYFIEKRNFKIALIPSKFGSNLDNVVEVKIISKLREFINVEIVERKDLNKIISEKALWDEIGSDTSIIQNFKISGIDLLGIYNVDYFDERYDYYCRDYWDTRENRLRENCRRTKIYEIAISFKVIDLSNSKVIFAEMGSSKALSLEDCIDEAIEIMFSKLKGG
jgi:hypothetical protein